MYLLAKGDCEVSVMDENSIESHIQTLHPGHMFGEVAVITQNMRTANVQCKNYCTIAAFEKETFEELCTKFPDIYTQLKANMSVYQDRWKIYLKSLLNGVHYFKDISFES